MGVARRALRTAFPLLLILITAIAVGNLIYNLRYLDTGEEFLPETPARLNEGEPPAMVDFGLTGGALRNFFLALTIAIFAIMIIAFIIAFIKGEKLRDLMPIWEIVGILLAGAFLIVAFLMWEDIVAVLNDVLRYPSGNPPPGKAGPGGGLEVTRVFPVGMIITIAVAFAIVAFALIYHVYPAVHHHVTYKEPEREKKRLETLQLVRQSIQDLEEGGDPRLVILRCYAAMCGVIEKQGLPTGEFLTPREFQRRARQEIRLSEAAMLDVTRLFEEARYSTHRMGEADAQRAIQGLSAVRAELEVQHGPA